MSSILDLIGSLIFGGALLVIILSANSSAVETQSTYQGNMSVQEMLTSVVQTIESEYRNMGYSVQSDSASILAADSTSITFLTSSDGTGTTIDTVRYWIGPTSELLSTPNELDRVLYRQLNSQPREMAGIVTLFSLRYLAAGGTELSRPVSAAYRRNIRTIEITLEVQNSYALYREPGTVAEGERNALYSSSLWQQTRLASPNFRR